MGWAIRIGNLGRRERVDAEIGAELRSHIEMAVEDAMHAGMSEMEARRAARLRFGNPVTMRERTIGADTALALEGLWRDVKFALRQLRKSPGFAATAIVTLALGIGATTAVFTLIQQVLLRSLPVAKPGQLWRIGDSAACCYAQGYAQSNGDRSNDWSLFSWEAYRQFRANTPGFQELAAFEIGEGNAELAVRRAGSSAPPQTSNGEYVSGNFFRTFGLSAWRGRLFTGADDREGAPPVAVMSFHAWQEQYASDPSVVGAAVAINGHPFTVIGIAPPGFFGAKIDADSMPDIWLPLTTEPLIAGATSRLKNPGLAWLDLIGRVRPGMNPTLLEAQLQGELHQWLASHVADMSSAEKAAWQKQTLHLTPGGAGVSLLWSQDQEALRLLLAAAVCVLLVACANIANLLLARGLRNRRQIAVHMALGSPRARLVRKALVESLVLAGMGGAAGIAVAWAGARLILHLAYARSAPSSWIPLHAAPSMPVLLFALGVAALTGVLFGIAPAWMMAHADPMEALRGANRALGGDRHWLQKTLVIVQTAASVVLLSAAAMLGRSLHNLEHQNFGFDPAGRYLVSIDPKATGVPQPQLVPLFREVESRLRAIPGVRGAGSVLEAPPGGWVTHEIRVEGRPEPGPKDDVTSGWTRVTPGFFPTLGDRIVMGRSITDPDDASTHPVAVVNQAFAKKFFAGRNPIGQHFGPAPEKNAGLYTIVGVAANVEFENDPRQPMYFLPEAQTTPFDDAEMESREIWSHDLYNIVLWAPGGAINLEAQVKKAIADVDPDLLMNGMEPYSDVLREFPQQNMIASLTWLFGAIGLVLAAVGLYGVTAYGVEQRRSEIGVRMALGANRGSVMALVLRGAFLQVAIGLALGVPAAIGAGILMASQLYGVSPWDPRVLLAVAGVLGLAALVAALLPARRAAGVDPIQALRME
ncbi:MAG TPA: ABC transporter permease [Acidobacteriaceae bacterium]|jgi:predicted permease|nr:ABC transporter permease [Acidobacteriaceae bacterium]